MMPVAALIVKPVGRPVADQAMAVLRQAVRAGYQDSNALRKDADLEPLRTRKDFQALLANLEGDRDFPAPTGERDRWSGLPANSYVWRLDLSADGRRLVSGGTDKAASLWDVDTGKLLRRLLVEFDFQAHQLGLQGERYLDDRAVHRLIRRVRRVRGVRRIAGEGGAPRRCGDRRRRDLKCRPGARHAECVGLRHRQWPGGSRTRCALPDCLCDRRQRRADCASRAPPAYRVSRRTRR